MYKQPSLNYLETQNFGNKEALVIINFLNEIQHMSADDEWNGKVVKRSGWSGTGSAG